MNSICLESYARTLLSQPLSAIHCSIATLVPFTYLDDLISSGILLAFTITDASVILVRQTSPTNSLHSLEKKMIAFNTLSFVTGLFLRNCSSSEANARWIHALTILVCLCTLFIGYQIQTYCRWTRNEQSTKVFLTPFVPLLPLTGCFVNLYLIAQLELSGLLAISGYVVFFVGLYLYHVHVSKPSWRHVLAERTVSMQ